MCLCVVWGEDAWIWCHDWWWGETNSWGRGISNGTGSLESPSSNQGPKVSPSNNAPVLGGQVHWMPRLMAGWDWCLEEGIGGGNGNLENPSSNPLFIFVSWDFCPCTGTNSLWLMSPYAYVSFGLFLAFSSTLWLITLEWILCTIIQWWCTFFDSFTKDHLWELLTPFILLLLWVWAMLENPLATTNAVCTNCGTQCYSYWCLGESEH